MQVKCNTRSKYLCHTILGHFADGDLIVYIVVMYDTTIDTTLFLIKFMISK